MVQDRLPRAACVHLIIPHVSLFFTFNHAFIVCDVFTH